MLCALAALLALFFAMPGVTFAQSGVDGFGPYMHTRWTAADGAPIGVASIAQTPDGWIWLGSARGLYRFDGVTFERAPTPPGSRFERASVRTLLVSRAGELWVGFNKAAGVAVFRGGRLVDTGMTNPPDAINRLVELADGTVLAIKSQDALDNRTFLWRGGRWTPADKQLNVPRGNISAACQSRDGTYWIGIGLPSTAALYHFSPRDPRFVSANRQLDTVMSCASDRDGRVWLRDRQGLRLLVDAAGRLVSNAPTLLPPTPGFALAPAIFDAHGGVWQATGAAGIVWSPAAPVSRPAIAPQGLRFTAAQGLSDDLTIFVLADSENNIWVGTDMGLDRFKRSIAQSDPLISGDPAEGYMLAQTGPELYIASSNGVFQVAPGATRKIIDDSLGGICGGATTGFWAVNLANYFRFDSARRPPFAPPPAGTMGRCAEDRTGRLWSIDARRRPVWHDASGWHDVSDKIPGAGHSNLVTTPQGEAAYTSKDRLIRLVGDQARVTPFPGASIGAVTMVAPGRRDMFVAGEDALLRIRGDAVARIDWRRIPWIVGVRALVQADDGFTWIRSDRALTRLSTSALDRAFDDPKATLARTSFDERDGLRAFLQPFFVGPSMAMASDGRLWELDRNGPSFIDPASLVADRRPPPVVIRSIAAGGATYLDPANLVFAPGTRSLDIAFTALRQKVPERARFRYQLEGVDDGWVDAGAKRTVSYSNLGPGAYRFRVIAANGDGVWNKDGATLSFRIKPTFVQSWPFYALCALAFAAVLYGVYALRVRAVANSIRSHMAERLSERERIARELHDTLLQSVQSLTLRFQLAVDDLPKNEPARPALEQAIDRADDLIVQGRDRVRDLRSLHGAADAAQIVADVYAQQGFGPDVSLDITTQGASRPLAALVAEELSAIANEALFNTRRHAGASRVDVLIDYGRAFTLRIADDGRGIPEDVLAQGGRDGHYGLSGMHERGRKLGGSLALARRPTGGTELTLIVPGSIAYAASGRGLLARFGKR
ncbi:sensor histidine kinase [Caulobacter sp. 602-1]|uniref:sensor histidine kinase n=1 Tax=Caulobacter sp. 602-1 TaxID=2492472 RepID=UPI00131540B8|nr:sensor histidine kinase [Caulobacter sp. 602-1]